MPQAGETSLPSPDEDFAEGYRLAARLHTFAQTQGFVIRAVKVGSYRCAKSQCPVRLAGRWDADREVWRLTEQNLDHSHIISGSDGGADAMDVRGDADKEIGRLGSKTAATTATASPTPGAPLFETEEEQQASQSSPHSALPPTPRHRKTPAPCSPLPFDLECNAGPAPKDDGPAHEQTPRLSPTPSCRPIRRRHSSPSPSFPHQTAFADAPSQLKKPRLTIDTQYEAPKHQPPTPRSDFLSFDHLDSELGTLPFKDLLLGVAADLLPDLSKPQLVLLVKGSSSRRAASPPFRISLASPLSTAARSETLSQASSSASTRSTVSTTLRSSSASSRLSRKPSRATQRNSLDLRNLLLRAYSSRLGTVVYTQ